MNKQMTPWFPSDIEPARAGVYEVKFLCFGRWYVAFSYWDGYRWYNDRASPEDALGEPWTPGANQNKEWRGFTEEQK
jgi:hypothetical protein